MLYTDFSPTPAILESVQRILSARTYLDPLTRFPYEFSGELRRQALAQSVHYSTRLEGNTLTIDQVHAVLAGRTVNAPADQVREVENYRDAMSFVQSLAIGRELPITEETIRTIHFLISKNLSASYAAGRYRTEQNFVVDQTRNRRVFFPPPPEDVPTLMAEYVGWLNSRHQDPAPIKAALAHLNLVAIHPFLDGNGRTARVLESLVMYAGDFRSEELVSLETYYGRDNQGYYRALRDALGPHYSPPSDVTSWVEYHVQAHATQSQAAADHASSWQYEFDTFASSLSVFDLSHRQTDIVWMVCISGRFTNRDYRQATEGSAQQAITDFNALVDKGLLVRVGGGRSTAYVPSPVLWGIYSRATSEQR